jgi:DGQHR domain-containing protein
MKSIPALVVKQWLEEWDGAKFEPVPPRGKPEPHFFVFSVSAYDLKRLTGIYRRDKTKPPAEDMGIQRHHDPDRSAEILRFLQSGFPLSRIQTKRLVDSSEIPALRMPGWLPTAIVVNILKPDDQRGPKDRRVEPTDLVAVNIKKDSVAEISLPAKLETDQWQPAIHPIEVIDGQHRLWALEEPEEDDEKWAGSFREKIRTFEVPVVAFHGLDRTWQAYLFYTINQLSKKIDTSMVFDLYPLLRTEDWLLRFEGPNIYRQTRAQDLTILLWSHPDSPWKERILRLGGREKGKITQAAFINSLMSSFIRKYDGGRSARIGGLFGSRQGKHELELDWVREQQAAFLIMCWQQIRFHVIESTAQWAKELVRRNAQHHDARAEGPIHDILFSGPETLLATDQGVRGCLNVLNDLLFLANEGGALDLRHWNWVRGVKQDDNAAVSEATRTLASNCKGTISFVSSIAETLASFDWRLSSSISPNDSAYNVQASYRGSGGYKEIRRRLLVFLKDNGKKIISDYAAQVLDRRGYEFEEGDE